MTDYDPYPKHTPGPWSYDGFEGVVGSDGFSIAGVDDTAILPNWEKKGVGHWAHAPGETFIERGADVQAANGYLIAAAPDLHRAIARRMQEQG